MLKKHKKNIYLEVDGGVNPLNIKNLAQAGANLIVAGSAIFKDGKDFYEKNIRALKVPRVK
jgi:ribulose-phosphate 3-epimerase